MSWSTAWSTVPWRPATGCTNGAEEVAEEDLHASGVETVVASENGSAHHDASADHATRRRPKTKRATTRSKPARASGTSPKKKS